jgi:DNA-binding CsgD family transcriptional regulator
MKEQFHGLISLNGDVLYSNPASLELIGAKLEDVVGIPIWDTPWHADEPGQPEIIKGMVKRAAEGGGPQRCNFELNLPSGRMLVEQTIKPVLDLWGKTVSMIPGATPKGALSLSAREKEVLVWTGKGKTAWEIGAILEISRRTVEFHSKSIRQKLNANSVAHAIGIAIRAGIIGLCGTGICGIGISAALQSPTISKWLCDVREVVFIIA